MLAEWDTTRTLIFCDEARTAPPMPDALAQVARGTPAALLIGPEGGFSPDEATRLREHPATLPVSLGPRILRADTAAVAALALAQVALGDWTA
jgi:16S rRNA (uracil1498-N3)-methyltransferase